MWAAWLFGSTLCAVMLLGGPAFAEPMQSQLGIWYRSGDGCPAGDAFVERLLRRGVVARVASVGDRVDFVVTLGAATDGYAGRLERQTSAGVVAIRQLAAETCSEVADALALTLAVSNMPGAVVDAPPAATPALDTPVTTAPAPERAPAGLEPAAPALAAAVRDESEPRGPSSHAESRWALGAQGLVFGGIAPTLLPAIGAFVEHTFRGSGVLVPTFRLSGFGGAASASSHAGTLDIELFAARFEACPLQVASTHLSLRPCLGADGGVLRAELESSAGRAASGLWVSLLAHPRLVWSPIASLAIDTHAGISVPVTQRDVVLANETAPLYQTATVGLEAGIAVAYRWP